MHLTLLTVGKTDIPWVREGLEMYSSRLKHYVPFEVREIPELKGVSALSREQIKEKEGELILRQVKPGDEVFLLDEHGREYRSLEFAEWLGRRLTLSGRDLAQVRADLRLERVVAAVVHGDCRSDLRILFQYFGKIRHILLCQIRGQIQKCSVISVQ